MQKKQSKIVISRNMNEKNHFKMYSFLHQYNLKIVDKIDILLHKIKLGYDLCYPESKKTITKDINSKVTRKWLNDDLRNEEQKLLELYNQGKYNSQKKQEYKIFKKIHKDNVEKAKTKYIKNQIYESKQGKSKTMWSFYKKFTNTEQEKANITIKHNDNQIYKSSCTLANMFLTHFSESLKEKINSNFTLNVECPIEIDSVPHSMFLHSTNEVEICKIIDELPKNKGNGNFDIPTEVLKTHNS